MNKEFQLEKSINEKIAITTTVNLYIKREDLIHPHISGNKYRKLKYNLIEAKRKGVGTLLTFGGSFSNHIAAVASVGKALGFKTIGVIRGEELSTQIKDNPTLSFAAKNGMFFKFISRDIYRKKTSASFIDVLHQEFGDFYKIPEGGTNNLAIKGCVEILTQADGEFDYICCCVGTGGTISGLINSSLPHQKVLGFPALKGDFLQNEIRKFATKDNWSLITDYHFGGYAKITETLISFINNFKRSYNIQLDPIYTGKMMFGVIDLIDKNYFPKGSNILVIHSGGLQGIKGMNKVLKQKKIALIEYNESH